MKGSTTGDTTGTWPFCPLTHPKGQDYKFNRPVCLTMISTMI